MIELYQSAFAEPPWNEYMKCISCGVEYGIKETESLKDETVCKKCENPLELTEYWSREDVISDLNAAFSHEGTIVLVAENSDGLAGFTWGYRTPFEEFPFLEGKVLRSSSYIDEIAVKGSRRMRGIGTLLGNRYLKAAREQEMEEVVLRTDERNTASMNLFKKLGFSDIPDTENPRGRIYDPRFPRRIYMRRRLE